MKKISDIIEDQIGKMPFVEEAMQAGLINYSSLARMLQPQISKVLMSTPSEASIMMALKRRSALGGNTLNLSPKHFKRHIGDVFVRSDLSSYTFVTSSTLTEKQTQLLHEIQGLNDTYCSFTQGMHERTLVVSDHITDLVEQIYKDERILVKRSRLSSATVMLKASNDRAYGLYYYIFKMIAWYGINVLEVISTTNEIAVVVAQKDINDTFAVLMKIKMD